MFQLGTGIPSWTLFLADRNIPWGKAWCCCQGQQCPWCCHTHSQRDKCHTSLGSLHPGAFRSYIGLADQSQKDSNARWDTYVQKHKICSLAWITVGVLSHSRRGTLQYSTGLFSMLSKPEELYAYSCKWQIHKQFSSKPTINSKIQLSTSTGKI